MNPLRAPTSLNATQYLNPLATISKDAGKNKESKLLKNVQITS